MMIYKPYEYQTAASNFIKEHDACALLLDMGLGKTVITLTSVKELIRSGEVRRVLIIAPLRVAQTTWPSEIKKWDHLSDLTYRVATGTEKQRISALNDNADLYIINRENVDWLINNNAIKFNFDMVVVDELSSFKSYQAKRFKSLLKVRWKIKRIVGLTGTPSSNGLMDLWAEYKILDQGERLGKFITHYREKYFDPDKRNANVIFSYKLKPFAEQCIYDAVRDITISMKCTDYLKMPELINNYVEVELDSKESLQYKTLKQEMIVEIIGEGEIDAVNSAVLASKLLQMANGAVYGEEKKVVKIHDRKLDALEDLIEAANGKPVLVAYWYKHDLSRIKERFDCREILTDKDINDWNSGQIQVGLIHPASCSMGLNLQQGGSTLIWFGLTWSLELYEQTNARLWRQGQKDNVVIHHIITKNTMDEKVLKALENKNQVQEALIEAVRMEVNL